ncbi:uncharacterized protein TNCV_2091131 [Trichonephila clavipes]|nr:uncharacterized protein TNCV_2091131 [Trichonephila clavipes]
MNIKLNFHNQWALSSFESEIEQWALEGLTWEHDTLVLKPSPSLHNGNEVDDWMGLDEWTSWLKSQVRDSNRSQDIVNLNKFETIKTMEKIPQ